MTKTVICIGEFSCIVSFVEGTLKSKVYALPGTSKLFGTDWLVLFDLWELPVNSFCKKQRKKSKKKQKNISDLKNEFLRAFSEGLG